MPKLPTKDWSTEFREMGADAVRSALIGGKWEREKRNAARVWIENADAHAWQQKRAPEDVGKSGTFIVRLRSAVWWKYVGPVIMGAFALAFVVRWLR